MDVWRPEDNEGNALSDKEAEEKFIIWYNDVCEERMAMLEAEEAYQKRVKELENGLSDLLKGFEDAEKEVKYLRKKYEQSEDGEVYKEPYDKVYREREMLKEDETRSQKIIKTLQDENKSLKSYAKQAMNGRCTRSSLGYKGSALQTYSTDIEREESSEHEFSDNSGSAQYPHFSVTARNGTDDLKLPLVTHSDRSGSDSPVSDNTLQSAKYMGTTSVHTGNEDTQIYTRKNILTYRDEVRALLSERLTVEEQLASQRRARARNHNEARAARNQNGNRGGGGARNLNVNIVPNIQHEARDTINQTFVALKDTETRGARKSTGALIVTKQNKPSGARNTNKKSVTPGGALLHGQVNSVMKYKNVVRHLEKGLVVITASERMEALEQENKQLKIKLDKLEKKRAMIAENTPRFQSLDTPKSSSRRSTQRTQKPTTRKPSQVRLPKLPQRETGYMRYGASLDSSPLSPPSIDSSSRSAGDDRAVVLYKTEEKNGVFQDGYTSLLRKNKYNQNIL